MRKNWCAGFLAGSSICLAKKDHAVSGAGPTGPGGLHGELLPQAAAGPADSQQHQHQGKAGNASALGSAQWPGSGCPRTPVACEMGLVNPDMAAYHRGLGCCHAHRCVAACTCSLLGELPQQAWQVFAGRWATCTQTDAHRKVVHCWVIHLKAGDAVLHIAQGCAAASLRRPLLAKAQQRGKQPAQHMMSEGVSSAATAQQMARIALLCGGRPSAAAQAAACTTTCNESDMARCVAILHEQTLLTKVQRSRQQQPASQAGVELGWWRGCRLQVCDGGQRIGGSLLTGEGGNPTLLCTEEPTGRAAR